MSRYTPRVEAVVFCGIQGTGKSTFFRERFFHTHVRLNLDMLRTRRREQLLLQACLDGKAAFVADNTNPTVAERARYVGPARAAGFRVVGYYFESKLRDAIARNQVRPPAQRIPPAGIGGTAKRLQIPSLAEGFDALFHVRIDPDAEPGLAAFIVEPWREEPAA